MTDQVRCPMCGGDEMTSTPGRLEQSGDTYLPTTVRQCVTCSFTCWEPAREAHWVPVEWVAAPPRRAA